MDRRTFVAAVGASAASLAATRDSAKADETPAKPKPRSHKMVVGCQKGPTTPEMLDYFKRHGVDHICGYPPLAKGAKRWSLDDLKRTRDLCEQHGVTLAMVALPFLSSSHIDREQRGAIMLGDKDERDRDIDDIIAMIGMCEEVGIPAFKYNMSLLGVLRTKSTPGRGGTVYSTWKLKDAKASPELTRAGKVTAEMAWERITYFLGRVIPACEHHNVRAACHPHDPGVPPAGFQGICRVLGSFDGLKKFVSIHENPYHGLNLCLGTMAENLADPGREIHEVIRYFGAKKKIFNIHFRNIKGHRDDFREVFPDEGDMNMVEVARTLREVGFEGMVMPDHMPHHADDKAGLQAFAFGYGYIKAVLQAVELLG